MQSCEAAREGGRNANAPPPLIPLLNPTDLSRPSRRHRPPVPAPQWESAAGVALVFDIGNRESFTSAAKWLRRAQEARAQAGSSSTAPAGPLLGVLIGAKADFRESDVDRAEVSQLEAKAFAGACALRSVRLRGRESPGEAAGAFRAGGALTNLIAPFPPLVLPRRHRQDAVL